jgi:hypothetical protein
MIDARPRFIVALILTIVLSVLVYNSARAQVCPSSTAGPTTLQPMTKPYPECLPAPLGTGVGFTVRQNDAGVMTWHYCSDGFSYRYTFGVATWDALRTKGTGVVMVAAAQAGLASTQTAAASMADTPLSDPSLTPIWCPNFNEMVSKVPAPVPYTVATNGKYATRPTYPYTALATPNGSSLGTMTNTSDGSIAVSTSCDCVKGRVISGTGAVYCLVKPTSVTLCKKT